MMRVIETAIPLDMGSIKEFYSDKKRTIFKIKYSDCDVKGAAFVNYCSNLELRGNVELQGSSYEDKEEVVLAVLENPVVSELSNILVEIAQILIDMRGINFTFSEKGYEVFTKDERMKFILMNGKVLSRWIIFFNSMLVYTIDIMQRIYVERQDSSEGTDLEYEWDTPIQYKVPHIVDSRYVGKSVVSMFSIPSFLEVYLSVKPPKGHVAYLDVQFREHCFRRKNLHHFFAHEKNLLLVSALYELYQNDVDLIGTGDPGQEAP